MHMQGLALRGHLEEGNLYQLMKVQVENEKTIDKWLEDGIYISNDSVNEIFKLMAN